jgi:hypothetical protein
MMKRIQWQTDGSVDHLRYQRLSVPSRVRVKRIMDVEMIIDLVSMRKPSSEIGPDNEPGTLEQRPRIL